MKGIRLLARDWRKNIWEKEKERLLERQRRDRNWKQSCDPGELLPGEAGVLIKTGGRNYDKNKAEQTYSHNEEMKKSCKELHWESKQWSGWREKGILR